MKDLLKKYSPVLTALVVIVLCALLFGCGVNYHKRRIDYHWYKIESKGGKVSTDTVMTPFKIKIEGPKVQYEPRLISTGKPMIFIKDSVRTEVLIKKGKDIHHQDTIFIDVDCPDQEASGEVATAINKSVEPKNNQWWPWLLLLGILIGVAVTVMLNKWLAISVQKRNSQA